MGSHRPVMVGTLWDRRRRNEGRGCIWGGGAGWLGAREGREAGPVPCTPGTSLVFILGTVYLLQYK